MILLSKWVPAASRTEATWNTAQSPAVSNGDNFVLDITSGLDLSVQHDGTTLYALKQLAMQFGVVVIRNQSVSMPVSTFRDVGLYFGDLQVHRENYSWHSDFPDVNYISNMRDPVTNKPIGLNGGDVEQFHSDLAYTSTPTTFTMLMGLILPEQQGRTLFSNTVAAYDSLIPELQSQITNKIGVYSYYKHHPIDNTGGTTTSASAKHMDAVTHPLVYTHPFTHKQSIYASAADTIGVVGLSETESNELLTLLEAQVARPEFRYEHEWKLGDMVIWDNRITQHKAGGCPPDQPRKLIRMTVRDSTTSTAL